MENYLRIIAAAILVCVIQKQCLCLTEVCISVPTTVDACYSQSLGHPISAKSAKVNCLKRLMWHYEPNQTLTAQDLSYFSSLSGQGWPALKPKTGYRVRKEYRTLSDGERHQLNAAFQGLYKKGIIKKYADLHAEAFATAHGGAAFLAWHRVFLAMFEDELRLENPSVSLPYWDVSLDEAMDNPVNSILWSGELLGNGNGDVVTGPFAGWFTSRGPLWREYGSSMTGRLTSSDNLDKILTMCHTEDISYPLRDPNNEAEEQFVSEYHHNGVHNWVGGDMSDGNFAAYDPVFYMFHSFVDYEWERFRVRQINYCGHNPETDYPANTGPPGHGPYDLMAGFDGFKNIDGLRNDWTKNWYGYESRPECPNCGSPYLYCDKVLNRCVSHSRRTDYNTGYHLYNSGHFTLPVEPFAPDTILIPTRNFQDYDPSPLSDCRTKASAKHDAKKMAEKYNVPELSHPTPSHPSASQAVKTLTIIKTIGNLPYTSVQAEAHLYQGSPGHGQGGSGHGQGGSPGHGQGGSQGHGQGGSSGHGQGGSPGHGQGGSGHGQGGSPGHGQRWSGHGQGGSPGHGQGGSLGHGQGGSPGHGQGGSPGHGQGGSPGHGQGGFPGHSQGGAQGHGQGGFPGHGQGGSPGHGQGGYPGHGQGGSQGHGQVGYPGHSQGGSGQGQGGFPGQGGSGHGHEGSPGHGQGGSGHGQGGYPGQGGSGHGQGGYPGQGGSGHGQVGFPGHGQGGSPGHGLGGYPGHGQGSPSGHTQSPYQSAGHGQTTQYSSGHGQSNYHPTKPASQSQYKTNPPLTAHVQSQYQPSGGAGNGQPLVNKVIRINAIIKSNTPQSHSSSKTGPASPQKSVNITLSLPHNHVGKVHSQLKIIKGASNPAQHSDPRQGGGTPGHSKLIQVHSDPNTGSHAASSYHHSTPKPNNYPGNPNPYPNTRKYISLV